LGGVLWTALQYLGAYLIDHNLRHTSQVYGLFAVVLGLMAWMYLGAQMTLYVAELNVVRANRFWPRSMVQPPLTEADERVLIAIGRQGQRRPEQHLSVRFHRQAMHEAGEPPLATSAVARPDPAAAAAPGDTGLRLDPESTPAGDERPAI
jgi:acyl transferase domain-containing protein